MAYFINEIAQYIHEQNLDLTHLHIILPSQRAKKYLHKALFEEYQEPIFSPQIKTMNHWIQQLSPHPIIHSTRAIFKLYDTHLKVDKEESQTLDEFLKWGNILFKDFDEIDRYLVESKDLFKNLADIKILESWNLEEGEELSEGQKRFMRFWDLLQNYHEDFNKRLEKDEEFYMGKAYKYVANNIDIIFQEDKDAYFIFAGFNALSPAERTIIQQLEKMGRAKIFIDADEYYLHNKTHEAGEFMRSFMKKTQLLKLPFVKNLIAKSPKTIKVYNCPQSSGQAKVSASILYDQIPQNEISQTLLLLADESLIVPILKNIPKNVGETNITLGLPLRNTVLKSWINILFAVQEHFLQFKTTQVYHQDFIRFIKHPFLVGYCNEKELQQLNDLEQKIHRENWIFAYVNSPQFLELISPRLQKLFQLFFLPWKNSFVKIPKDIEKINQLIYKSLDEEKNALERAILYHFNQSILQLEDILKEFQPQINLGTFKVLFNQHWMNETVAYYGNPLNGLQVMGLLETRLLDFKNLIVVGLNEGSLPPVNPIQTLIPMDLRRFHQLPLPRDKQGIFAHHFYRLLHHAENIWLTYSSADRDMGGIDEPSRYITQLELELTAINPQITFEKYDYLIEKVEKQKSREIAIEKSSAVIQRLDEYFSNKTSTSALKNAINCPLDFYYKYLLGMGEEKGVEEDIEANTFGSFIHETLEELYFPFAYYDKKGVQKEARQLNDIAYEELLKAYPTILNKHFENFFNYSNSGKIEGKNYLSKEMAIHLTGEVIKKEKREKQNLKIISLERELRKTLHLEINGEKKKIQFVGVLDRIDEIDGKKRIIDYKTGKCEEKDVKITKSKNDSEEERVMHLVGIISKTKYVFQLLTYNMLFFEHYGYYPDKVGIISFLNLQDSPHFLINKLTDTTEELMILFEKALVKIIADLYNDKELIRHNEKAIYCDYCLVITNQ